MKIKLPHSGTGRSFARLERVVTVLVEAKLTDGASRPDLIERLCRLEETVRKTQCDRQTLQVIESGRRLLGDANGTSSAQPVTPLQILDDPVKDSPP